MIDTLKDARDYVNANRVEGVHCPCCGQMARDYRRKLNTIMARALIWLVRTSASGDEWVDIGLQAPRWFHRGGGEFAKLAHWGLIEERLIPSTRGGRTSGIWRPTDKGVSFARNEIAIASHVTLYDNHIVGISNTSITIRQALGEHFDFQELWGNSDPFAP